MQLRVDFGRAGDQGELVAAVGIQPLALNSDGPLGHFQGLQLAVGTQHRLAGGQRRVRGVDKAAAVTGDAIGVSNHDVGRFPATSR